MTKKKTILGIIFGTLMALCMILGIAGFIKPQTVHAGTVSGISGGTIWTYDFDNKTFTVSPKDDAPAWKKGWMGDYERYEDTPWGDDYDIEDDIEKVIIKEGVVKVGNNAFEDCGGIREISLPKSLHTIGYYAFDYAGHCHNEEIQMGTIKLPLVGGYAFRGSKITGNVIMQDGWYGLGEYAFSGSRITSVYIGKQGKGAQGEDPWWEESAFANCDSLIDVTFGEGLTWVQEGTFEGCDNLRCVEFPESMRTVCDDAFDECYAIQNVYCIGEIKYIWFGSDNWFIANRTNYHFCENWEPTYIYKVATMSVTKTCNNFQILLPGSKVINGNEWLVRTNYEIYNTLEVTEDSTLVLLNNSSLTVHGSIHVHPNKTLTIVSESLDADKMGSLKTYAPENYAGIGSGIGESGAKIVICEVI